MANWLNQLQSLLGQKGSSASSSGEQGLSKLLVPGALGGLAGLLVANKSSRKLLSKYGTSALLVGGGAVAGTVLWNKYKDKVRAAHQDEPQFGAQSSPLDERTERLILALVFAAKSDGHIDAKERSAIEQQLREAGVEEQGRVLIERAIEQPLDPQRLAHGIRNEEEAGKEAAVTIELDDLANRQAKLAHAGVLGVEIADRDREMTVAVA